MVEHLGPFQCYVFENKSRQSIQNALLPRTRQITVNVDFKCDNDTFVVVIIIIELYSYIKYEKIGKLHL